MDKITQLENRIVELEKQMTRLQQSNTIPYTVENALIGRGFLRTSDVEVPPGDWDLNEGFIVTSGSAQAPATKYLRLTSSKGVNYWIALYTFSELA